MWDQERPETVLEGSDFTRHRHEPKPENPIKTNRRNSTLKPTVDSMIVSEIQTKTKTIKPKEKKLKPTPKNSKRDEGKRLNEYNSNICAAFESGNENNGFNSLQEMVNLGLVPGEQVFQSYWNLCARSSNVKENVEKILKFLEDNPILLSTSSADGLKRLLIKSNIKFQDTNINQRLVALMKQ